MVLSNLQAEEERGAGASERKTCGWGWTAAEAGGGSDTSGGGGRGSEGRGGGIGDGGRHAGHPRPAAATTAGARGVCSCGRQDISCGRQDRGKGRGGSCSRSGQVTADDAAAVCHLLSEIFLLHEYS